ncbi:CheR family methyltransferase [Burkholderia stagnalis]|uniref:CheR family methyltransferase n=1 Tax=Burkholderia stagnalis TaxID=1503054 RepID=UPI000752A75A|nr:CheR family methyltransferase [Burkholderia stagnalis]KWH43022.1 MCP methyltransferase [Burkholderia stagnalis]KWH47530.1 MCP methyltransferase [Burkholderia stagnalis]
MSHPEWRFRTWLLRETGIDPASLGNDFLMRALTERIHATRAAQGERMAPVARAPVSADALDAYWQHLNASADERRALIELFVVPETWFFRDREAFATLARLAVERRAARPAHVVRVLSAPCSSGEEPFSAAMALLDAGLDPAHFTIDAIDLSDKALDHARLGRYGRNAFRGAATGFRSRHFTQAADGWLLDDRVRACVQFRRANLIEPLGDPGARYDFVFCRNVLIYFDRDAQDRVIRSLERSLADDGMLFVGPAETGVAMRHGLRSARIPLAFAFQRASAAERLVDGLAAALPAVPPAPSVPRWRSDRYAAARVAAPRATPAWFADTARPIAPAAAPSRHAEAGMAEAGPDASGAAAPTLEHAQALANAGAFDEAERALERFIAQAGPHADAYCLHGLIADARGRTAEASDFYRKALYLRPTHHEALTHLATLLDAGGDGARAQWLLERARRTAGEFDAGVAQHTRLHDTRTR